LQVLDLQADGGLGQMQLRGSARQIAFARDRRKCAEQGEVHPLILTRLISQLSITHWICGAFADYASKDHAKARRIALQHRPSKSPTQETP
jgi:hypothetical protein